MTERFIAEGRAVRLRDGSEARLHGLVAPGNAELNMHAELVREETLAWIERHGLTPDRLPERVRISRSTRIGGAVFPRAEHEVLRVLSDWIALATVVNVYASDLDFDVLRTLPQRVLGAAFDIASPGTPTRGIESSMIAAAVDVGRRIRALPSYTSGWQERFGDACFNWLMSLGIEKVRRSTETKPISSSVLGLRVLPLSSGIASMLLLSEVALPYEVSGTAWADLSVRRLARRVSQQLCWLNDLLLPEREGVAERIREELGCGTQEAVDIVVHLHNAAAASFVTESSTALAAHPEPGLVRHVRGLLDWQAGYLFWAVDEPRTAP